MLFSYFVQSMAFARASAFLSRRMRHGLSCELCLLFTQRYNKKCIMQAFMPTFCVKACSKNPPQRFNRCSLYCSSLSFCFCLASFAFSFRKHSSLCSFQGLSKTCSAKSQNTAKVIFRTRLKDRTKRTNRTQTKLLSSLPSL